MSISDSPFAYIDNGNEEKKEQFLKLRDYILSGEGQQILANTGRRTWYGGVTDSADKNIFNPNWGIDTTRYIVPLKFPSTEIIQEALGLYQSELRKPISIAFCLDYSGSMAGKGNNQLVSAMDFILTSSEASKNLLQFTSKDKIYVIPFSSYVLDTWSTSDGSITTGLLNNIHKLSPSGGTNIYDTSIEALRYLSKDDGNTFNRSVVLMTDGQSNTGNYKTLDFYYNNTLKQDIPVYSIMFGDAEWEQLDDVAELTNAKVFDGRTDLLEAFKEVRGYN